MNETTLAISPPADPVGLMLEKLVSAGVGAENVAALEKLVGLYERNQAKNAEQEFARAFAELQKDMPKIQATRAVPNKDGTERYRFAPFEEIMREAQPFLSSHGFAISFNTKWDGPRIVVSCKLLHSGGHSQTNEFAARVGDGPPGSNAAQADGAVKTLAKRNALCDALNIVVERDTDGDDARIEGDVITPAQAKEILDLIEATGTDKAKLLAFAKADTVVDIRQAHFQEVFGLLEKKLKKKAQSNPTGPDNLW